MKNDAFKYIGFYTLSYLILSGIEIYLLRPLVDFVSTNFWFHFVVYLILLLIVNPFVVKWLGMLLIKDVVDIIEGE